MLYMDRSRRMPSDGGVSVSALLRLTPVNRCDGGSFMDLLLEAEEIDDERSVVFGL